MDIIGITGTIGSGKSTIANRLVRYYGYHQVSFADTLKDAAAAIFGWPRQMLEGDTKASREWRDRVDPWWAHHLNIPHFTPRWALQHLGTDILRTHFNTDIWVLSTMRSIQGMSRVVVSDVRFSNEASQIKSQGGKVWRVMKEQPKWWNLAQTAVNGDRSAQSILDSQGVHSSEWQGAAIIPDVTIENTGTRQELYDEIDKYI